MTDSSAIARDGDDVVVFLALGSNLGDRRAFLEQGLAGLSRAVMVEAVSRVVESDPWGPVAQSRFLNLVVRGRTRLPPPELLDFAHGIEAEAGRIRSVRFGPRPLDVDLIFYGNLVIDGPQLTVPHPRWAERPFVYGLLVDVADDFVDPRSGRRVSEIVADATPRDGLEVVAAARHPISSTPAGPT